MNYHEPRQLQDANGQATGRWHYTVFNDHSKLTHAEGYCAEPGSPCHKEGHATRDEAYDCYRRYLLDKHLKFHEDDPASDTLHRCQLCQNYTSGFAEIGGTFSFWWLCAAHRNRAAIESFFTVGDSFGSI